MKKSRHRVQPVVYEHLRLNDGHHVRDEQLLEMQVVLDSARAGRIEKAYPVGDQRKQRRHVELIRL